MPSTLEAAMEASHYSIQLTPGELAYAAQLLQVDRLFLPFGLSEAWRPALQSPGEKAQQSLMAKKLLARQGSGHWQMDELLAKLVLWVANPQFALFLQTCWHGKEALHVGAYRQAERSLLVHFMDEEMEFVIYQQQEDVFDQILAMGGVEAQGQTGHPLSLPAMGSGWPQQADAWLQQESQLTFASQYQWFIWQNDEPLLHSQAVLVGNHQALWRVDTGALSELITSPISVDTAKRLIAGSNL